ncbi:hypothetical protein [Rhizobium sp.]
MDDEERENWALIMTPAGEEWSGRARYAAAMYFFRRNEMSAEVLEIYRICSRIDHEDAVDALKAYRMGQAWIEKVENKRRELAESVESRR